MKINTAVASVQIYKYLPSRFGNDLLTFLNDEQARFSTN